MAYFRKDTGIKTEQNENCDYFDFVFLGIDLKTNMVKAHINFWEQEKHVNKERPNQVRILSFNKGANDSIQSGIDYLLTLENFKTDEGEELTLKGATEI